MKSTPAKNSIRTIVVYTLAAAVTEVHADGDWVVGSLSEIQEEFYGRNADTMIQDFANWPADIRAIVKFTKRYGPLTRNSVSGEPFRFHVDDWKEEQAGFQFHWKGSVKFQETPGQHVSTSVVPVQHELLVYQNHRLEYQAASLLRLLELNLSFCPPERIRCCRRPDCPTPYFIAHHLRQRFCSDVCARWGQSMWKRDWWEKHGNQWRKIRKKKERKHGKKSL